MVPCQWCASLFEPRHPTARYCSRQCGRNANNTWQPGRPLRTGYSASARPCRRCGAALPIPSPRVTLCDGCRTPERACRGCGTRFRRAKPGDYCSRACGAGPGQASPTWSGGHRAYRGPGWQRLRDAIRERDGWTCRGCGADRRGRKLDAHHLVPAADWEHPGEANDPTNLVSLCPGCHRNMHLHQGNAAKVLITTER